jgi:arabinoxylan arabinofuranohydrolase
MNKLFLLVFAIALIASCQTQKLSYPKTPKSTNDATIIGQLKYPYHFKYEGNPLSRMHGAADPSAHVWDDEVWVITSQDRNMDSTKHRFHYAAMDGYHAFSTKDMINWTNHGEIFHSSDLNKSAWGDTPENYMWAPSFARKQDDKGKWTYYLYYPHNVNFKGEKWVTGVATAPTPIGPFTDLGPLKGGEMGMDPMVFIDDDGQAYIYANPMIVAKLKPDMVTLAESPRKIEYATDSVLQNELIRFCEGLYMHKRNGIYYLSYSNWKNKQYQGFYAMGNSPYGPFEWKGPMAPSPVGAQDHHSIINFKGQSYYFYHIAIPDMPKYKESQGRIVCFDKLFYNEDGTIQMLKHTR